MALRAVGLRRVQRGDTFGRRVHPEFDIGEGANVQLGGAGYAVDQLDSTVWGGCRVVAGSRGCNLRKKVPTARGTARHRLAPAVRGHAASASPFEGSL